VEGFPLRKKGVKKGEKGVSFPLVKGTSFFCYGNGKVKGKKDIRGTMLFYVPTDETQRGGERSLHPLQIRKRYSKLIGRNLTEC